VSEELTVSIIRTMMKAVSSSETYVIIYQNTRFFRNVKMHCDPYSVGKRLYSSLSPVSVGFRVIRKQIP
jgi:hypothetical protein